MLDRIDICAEASRIEYKDLKSSETNEDSETIRGRVVRAAALQKERYNDTGIRFNSDLTVGDIDKYCHMGPLEEELMKSAYERFRLSARAFHRIIKVARTIADLDGSEEIKERHLSEAIGFRSVEGRYWNG